MLPACSQSDVQHVLHTTLAMHKHGHGHGHGHEHGRARVQTDMPLILKEAFLKMRSCEFKDNTQSSIMHIVSSQISLRS